MIIITNIYNWISDNNIYYFVYFQLADGSREVVECQTFEDLESIVEDMVSYNASFGY